ncbi:hypothetical protein F4861DRAFT_534975 [Xylaria intraflava]|nr:hypothetical protein F4861DRAFT_534975 [Xylaria intraflava]
MIGPVPRFKAQGVVASAQKRKMSRQHSSYSRQFDPLDALGEVDEDVPDVGATMSADARRMVDDWLDHTYEDHTTDPICHETHDDASDANNASYSPEDINTLDIVSRVLSRPPEEDDGDIEESAPPLGIPLTEAAVHIIESARQREAAGLDVDQPLFDVASGVDGTSETITDGVSHPLDKTREVRHRPTPPTLSAFHTMLAIWENEHSVSRDAHSQLVEIFQLANSLEEIQLTAKTQGSPIHRVVQSLPLWRIRTMPVTLDHTVLPTRTKLKEDLVVLDLRDIVMSILSSPYMRTHAYHGMAHLTDSGIGIENPWQANWWGESIRSTSGQFFHYNDGSPIFPSDFIIWRCPGPECRVTGSICHTHYGRVRYCGWDKRGQAASPTDTPDIPVILVQNVVDKDCVTGAMSSDLQSTCFSHRTIGRMELIIVEDDEVSLTPDHIIEHVPEVVIDYYYDPTVTARPGPLTSPCTVRLIYNQSRRQYRVVKLSSPHRAELELRAYGRRHFVERFAQQDVVSLPFQMFIDAFGLYRNMYRSLMGVYLTPEFLPPQLRSRRANIFPLTLGPHGADLTDVLAGLFHMKDLDAGTELDLWGRKVFVCSFVNCITGDMPSQQKLAGCLSPRATLPCRNCFVKGDAKSDLGFDIINQGRYHMQTEIDRRQVQTRAKSTRQEENLLRELGLHNNKPLINTLEQLFPALDMIRSRPVDAAHSEYQGLSRLVHNFMFKDQMAILTPSAITEACTVYQEFTAPPRWGRLQSPKRHLDSWRMQELARGSIILPVLLRCWLQPGHVREECRRIIPRIAPEYFSADDFIVPIEHFTATDWMISATWCFARSVLAIFGKHSDDRPPVQIHELPRIIIAGRKAVQFLCQVNAEVYRERGLSRAASKAIKDAKEARGRIAAARAMHVSSQASDKSDRGDSESICETEYTETDVASVTSAAPSPKQRARPQDKAQSFIAMKGLPNIHSGLHLCDVIREYGSCRLVWTLLGEDKHREYKSNITKTNHRNPGTTLINHENISQALRFVMEGCFEQSMPELHQMFGLVKQKCPTFARTLVPFIDIYEDEGCMADDDVPLQGDATHRYPRAQLRFRPREVAERDNPMLNVVDLRYIDNSGQFGRELLDAHRRDYDNDVVILGTRKLSWWRRMVYVDRYHKRISFTVGSFVKLSYTGTSNRIGKIEGLFIHERANSSWLFLVVAFTERCSRVVDRDYILQCPLYQLTGEVGVVGLSRVVPEYIWMVPGPENSLLFVDYDVSFI